MATTLRESWNLLAVYLAPQRARALLLALCLVMAIAIQLGIPLLLRRFIDQAETDASLRALLILAGTYTACAIGLQFIRLGETWAAQYVALSATNELRADLAGHVLDLDLEWHANHTPGELIERIDGDVFTLGNFFSTFIINVIGNITLAIGVVAILTGIDWRVGLTIGLTSLVTVGVMIGFAHWNAPRYRLSRERKAALMGFLEERISGTEDIRAAGATGYVMHGFHEHSRSSATAEVTASGFGQASFSVTSLLSVIGMVVSLWISSSLYRAGDITLGTVFLVFQFSQIIVQPIEELARQFSDFQQASASIDRIRELLALTPNIKDGDRARLPDGPLDIVCDHVTFGYAPDHTVLHDVSFALSAGQVLGVVGRTGSGKTSIIRLLTRLYDPTEGAIRIGGVDLHDVPLTDLRQRIALVTQDIQLFRATLRDNLTLFDASIPDALVTDALQTIGMGSWLANLPEGLGTMIESGGTGVSAGEAQLLAFTRAFLRDPDIVILDEASSRIDPATEARLEQAIDQLLAGRTAVIIAHRLATLTRTDRILVMADGHVVEDDDRATLAANPSSHFATMLRTGTDFVAAEGAT